MEGLDRYTRPAPALHAFGARVFKVSQDEQGARLTWLRVTGGELKVKTLLTGEADGEPWAEKANQLRLYSGAKYTLSEAIGPGQVCAVTGLTHAKPGTGLGAEQYAGSFLRKLHRADHFLSGAAFCLRDLYRKTFFSLQSVLQ